MLSVCLSVCQLDYCISSQLVSVSLRLDVMIGPISRKNLLTFGGDLVLDTKDVRPRGLASA